MEKIIINTTKTGVTVYEIASKNLTSYFLHLETINRQRNQLTKVLELFPNPEDQIDLNNLYSQLKFNSLITISFLDLSVVGRDIILAQKPWDRLFYAKQCYLIIYETINTFHKHKKELFRLVKLTTPKLQEELKEINLELKEFKNEYKYESEMNNIRNCIAGHIDEDFENYYNTLRTIDIEKTGKLLGAFLKIINRMQNFSNNLLKEYGERIEFQRKENEKIRMELLEKLNKIINNSARAGL